MDKFKRIIAIIAVVVIVVCVIVTLVFGILNMIYNKPFFAGIWRGSLLCMVFIPVVLYAMLLIYNQIKKRQQNK